MSDKYTEGMKGGRMRFPEESKTWCIGSNLRAVLAIVLLAAFLCGCSSGAGVYRAPLPGDQPDDETRVMQAFALAKLASLDGDLDESARALKEGALAVPASVKLQIALAEVELQRGDIKSARKAVETALSIDPEHLYGYDLLGEILILQEDFHTAVKVLRRARTLPQSDSKVTMNLAYALARTGAVDQALGILRELVANEPDNLHALLVLARFYRSGDLPEKSAETYRALLARAPDSELAVVELADVELELQRPEQAISLCLDYLARFPEDVLVRRRLASIYIELEKFDLALAQLELVVAADPEDDESLRRTGLIYLQRQDWDDAVRVFTRLLKQHPDNGVSRYDLGVALEAAGEPGRALTAFAGVPETSDLYADAIMHRAYLLFTLDRASEAQALLSAEMTVVFSRPEAVTFLASLYLNEDKSDAAETLLRNGQELFPEHVDILQTLALLLDQQGKAEEAETVARQIMTLDPENADAPNLIAYSLAVRGIRLDEALRLAQQALALEDAPHIRDTLGWVYFRLGRYEDARREIEQAAQALDDDPTVLEHLGDVLTVQGDMQAAEKVYRRALDSGRADDADALRRKIDRNRE